MIKIFKWKMLRDGLFMDVCSLFMQFIILHYLQFVRRYYHLQRPSKEINSSNAVLLVTYYRETSNKECRRYAFSLVISENRLLTLRTSAVIIFLATLCIWSSWVITTQFQYIIKFVLIRCLSGSVWLIVYELSHIKCITFYSRKQGYISIWIEAIFLKYNFNTYDAITKLILR